MQKRVKITVINGNRIEAVYGSILESDKLQVKVEQQWFFGKESIIIFPENNGSERNIFLLDVTGADNGIITFEKKENINNKFFENHYLEFSHIFSIAEVGSDNEYQYKSLAANINRQELNSTAARLKEVYSRDEVENREIITFLIDINSKLDEILYLLKPKEKIEGAEDYLSLIISEDGILFASSKEILQDKIFIYTSIRDSGGFFSFASICSVEKLMQSGNYIIYKALFTDLNFDTKDKIIKYIFRLEREMLKEANR